MANGFGAHVSSVTGYQCDAAPVMTRFVGNGWTVDARCIVPGRSAKQQYLGFGDFNGFSITRWPTNAGR